MDKANYPLSCLSSLAREFLSQSYPNQNPIGRLLDVRKSNCIDCKQSVIGFDLYSCRAHPNSYYVQTEMNG